MISGDSSAVIRRNRAISALPNTVLYRLYLLSVYRNLSFVLWQVKCHHYWPSEGSRLYGVILVELLEEASFGDYISRKFKLTHTEVFRIFSQVTYRVQSDVCGLSVCRSVGLPACLPVCLNVCLTD